MITAEKPALDEDLLMHFGIKGMKWGVRKPKDSSGPSSSKKMSTKKKIAIGAGGLAIAAGVVAATYLLKSRGGVKVPTASSVVNRVAHRPPVPHIPSPFEMRLQAGMHAQRNAMSRIGAQRLTDKAWRDQAKVALLAKDMDNATSRLLSSNLDSIRRALQDPNHVWQL